MHIVLNTPDQLIIAERPWILGVALIGFILVFAAIGIALIFSGNAAGLFALLGAGLGYAAFFAFVRRLQVVFHRPEGWVEIRRANLRGRKKVRHNLPEISRATVETSQNDGATLRRVTLVIDEGESAGRHPLTQHYSNIGQHNDVARAINDWLAAAK